jgi:hypothetical protein
MATNKEDSINIVNAYGPFPDWIMDVQWLQQDDVIEYEKIIACPPFINKNIYSL